jgi:transcriptional regulator with XRE-family HTH domain
VTPFGERIRKLRRERGIPQKDMAKELGVSPAYLSALEHGHRGAPSWILVQKIIGYFNIIWDEAEELSCLAAGSHPRAVIDTAGLSPEATRLANLLAGKISVLNTGEISTILAIVEKAVARQVRKTSDPEGNERG